MATIKENSNLRLADVCKEIYDSIRGLGADKEKYEIFFRVLLTNRL